VLRAIAGVDNGLLASAQPEAVRERVTVTGPISHRPPRNGVRNVIPVPDDHILGVQARVATRVLSWRVEIDLIEETVPAAFACTAVNIEAATTRKASRKARLRIEKPRI
jgi:hypothetical protein